MMMSDLMKVLHFYQLNNIELLDVLQTDKASILNENCQEFKCSPPFTLSAFTGEFEFDVLIII
jgi:hypothetical protein